MDIYKIDPCYYYSLPAVAFDAMLKHTGVRLELITCIDMHQFFEKSIRGGCTNCITRHAVANNKYMSDFDQTKPSSYIIYYDVNSLYGTAMSQYLPTGGFEWVENVADFNVMEIEDEGPYGYVLEVDLKYPKEIHDAHNDLPLCPENCKPPTSKNPKEIKLLCTLLDKKIML
jgi:hypothetical protein